MLRHAKEIPSWEIDKCWRYQDWPERTSVGVPLPAQDVGIDLVAVKHDDSRVAIQCKSRSGTGAVTITQVQKLGGAAPKPMFAERWMVVDAHWSAATEDAAAVAGVTFVLPCGTGKTRVSIQIMSKSSGPGDLGVVLVPSIALIAQVRREYLSHIGRPARTLAVCSNATAGHVDG